MAKGFRQFTYLIAKDISRKRQLKALKDEIKNPKEIVLNNMMKYNQLKDNKDLNVTLEIMSNPFKIISLIKKHGFKGLYKLFVAPISCIIIHHSFLPHIIKLNMEKSIHKSSKKITLKESIENTNKIQKEFKLVA